MPIFAEVLAFLTVCLVVTL